ncbi:MAG: hypothetical protein HYS86_05505 [Candidatus Chisholmbacteria bacterium]|nr:hypothetical protein [Candidatus Chisholmbacteria bacterium]
MGKLTSVKGGSASGRKRKHGWMVKWFWWPRKSHPNDRDIQLKKEVVRRELGK